MTCDVCETVLPLSVNTCCCCCLCRRPLQAYSVYDEEIGYCQGQSFLAAVLLLHVSTAHSISDA